MRLPRARMRTSVLILNPSYRATTIVGPNGGAIIITTAIMTRSACIVPRNNGDLAGWHGCNITSSESIREEIQQLSLSLLTLAVNTVSWKLSRARARERELGTLVKTESRHVANGITGDRRRITCNCSFSRHVVYPFEPFPSDRPLSAAFNSNRLQSRAGRFP